MTDNRTMPLINSSWKHYFDNHHEGLGSTYERFILHQYFENILQAFKIKSVLEAPILGMTGVSGINSMWWAQKKIPVTLMDHDQERIGLIDKLWNSTGFSPSMIQNRNGYTSLDLDDGSVDLGWNFAALWAVSDLEQHLRELSRVSRKVLFICIPNHTNIFHLIRSASGRNTSTITVDSGYPKKICQTMQKNNWLLTKRGYFDIPPWPDIAMKKEDLLKRVGLHRQAKKLAEKDENYLCILDYFSGKNSRMENEILKFSFLEDSFLLFQKLWAHHQYFLFTPGKDSPSKN